MHKSLEAVLCQIHAHPNRPLLALATVTVLREEICPSLELLTCQDEPRILIEVGRIEMVSQGT